jgi:hypothetical protein
VLARRWRDEAVKMLGECARDLAHSPRTRPLHQAGHAVVCNALPPCAEGRVGTVEGRRDRVDVVARAHRTDGWCPTKDAGLLGLLQHGLSSRQGVLTHAAVERTHRWAPCTLLLGMAMG